MIIYFGQFRNLGNMIFKPKKAKEQKLPKRADMAIHLLEGLVEQLHYFYGTNIHKFKIDVLKDAFEIENVLKDLAINKKETFKRLRDRYDHYYEKKLETHDSTLLNTNDVKLNVRIKEQYKTEVRR